MLDKKINTIIKRPLMEGKIVVEVTDLEFVHEYISTVYVVGQEVAHEYYSYKDVSRKEAQDAAVSWFVGALDTIEGLLKADLIKPVDFGDELFKEEE